MYQIHQNLKADENSQRRVADEAAKILAAIRAEKAQGKTRKASQWQHANSNFGMGM